MYGVSAFGAEPLCAAPAVWRAILEATAANALASTVEGQGVGVASTSAPVAGAASAAGGLVAVVAAATAMTVTVSMLPKGGVGWNASSISGLSAQLAGFGRALASAGGNASGASQFSGYRMWAYDQAFPANPSSGSIVQIGNRLFEWKVSSARWHPAGPAP